MQRRRKEESAQRRWLRDPEKERFWKKQLHLWQQSGLSVRAFCKESGIVETSFYAWRRELIIRAREGGSVDYGSPEDHASVTPNTVKDGRGRTISVRFRQTDQKAICDLSNESPVQSTSPFVPLSIVPDAPVQPDSEPCPTSVNTGIAITTPAGYRISVSCPNDVRLLGTILNILEDRKC
jgi:hypothetical protein